MQNTVNKRKEWTTLHSQENWSNYNKWGKKEEKDGFRAGQRKLYSKEAYAVFLNGQCTKTFDPSFLMILIYLLKNVRTWSRFRGYICTVESELFFFLESCSSKAKYLTPRYQWKLEVKKTPTFYSNISSKSNSYTKKIQHANQGPTASTPIVTGYRFLCRISDYFDQYILCIGKRIWMNGSCWDQQTMYCRTGTGILN